MPKNLHTSTTGQISFVWDKDRNIDFYVLYISQDITFSNYDSIVSFDNSAFYKASANTYYWKVKYNYNNYYTKKSQFTCIDLNDFNTTYYFAADSLIEYANNTPLDSLRDLSLNQKSLYQNNVNRQPIYHTTSSNFIKNKPVVYFDGVNDYMNNSFLNHSNNVNYFFVMSFVDDYVGYVFDGGSVNEQFFAPLFNTSLRFNSGSNLIGQSLIPLQQYFICNIRFTDVSGRDALVLNLTDSIFGESGDNSSNGFTLGSQSNFFNNISANFAELIIVEGSFSDSSRALIGNYLHDKYAPPVNLGANIYKTTFCDTILYAGKRFTDYLWQDNSTADSLVVSETGWYSCTVTDIFGFTSVDSVYVEYPTINTITYDTICQGDTLLWNTQLNNSDFNFLWNNGTTDSLLNITQPGDYWVKVTDSQGCFRYSDTITVAVDSFPTLTTLGPDKTICQGASIGLTSNTDPIAYLWSTSASTPQIAINTPGEYWLESSNANGCINTDTINITLNGIAPTVGFETSNRCTNEMTNFNDTSLTTDGSNIVRWHWEFGDGDTAIVQNPQHHYPSDGNYNVTLEILTGSGCIIQLPM